MQTYKTLAFGFDFNARIDYDSILRQAAEYDLVFERDNPVEIAERGSWENGWIGVRPRGVDLAVSIDGYGLHVINELIGVEPPCGVTWIPTHFLTKGNSNRLNKYDWYRRVFDVLSKFSPRVTEVIDHEEYHSSGELIVFFRSLTFCAQIVVIGEPVGLTLRDLMTENARNGITPWNSRGDLVRDGCSLTERGWRAECWAIEAPGKKRAHRLFSFHDEAIAWMTANADKAIQNDMRIVHRPEHYHICENICPFRSVCKTMGS